MDILVNRLKLDNQSNEGGSDAAAIIAMKSVIDTDDLMIINKSGVTIRMAVKDLRVMGRATQGVRLIRLDDDDSIASVTKVDIQDDENTPVILDETNVLPVGDSPIDVTDVLPPLDDTPENNESDDTDNSSSDENNPDEPVS